MDRRIIDFVIFAVGATAGSIATYFALDKKYALRAQEEIDAVRQYYANKIVDEKVSEEPTSTCTLISDNTVVFQNLTKDLGYSGKEEKKGGEDMTKKPYVISPIEFGEFEDYDTESLNYYSDGVLTDDFDNVIEDVDYMVGLDFASHFGEYEDDCVYIRNERQQIDYEILLDHRTYTEVIGGPPEQGD